MLTPAQTEQLIQLLTIAASLGTSVYICILAWRSPDLLRVFLAFVRALINDWKKRSKH